MMAVRAMAGWGPRTAARRCRSLAAALEIRVAGPRPRSSVPLTLLSLWLPTSWGLPLHSSLRAVAPSVFSCSRRHASEASLHVQRYSAWAGRQSQDPSRQPVALPVSPLPCHHHFLKLFLSGVVRKRRHGKVAAGRLRTHLQLSGNGGGGAALLWSTCLPTSWAAAATEVAAWLRSAHPPMAMWPRSARPAYELSGVRRGSGGGSTAQEHPPAHWTGNWAEVEQAVHPPASLAAVAELGGGGGGHMARESLPARSAVEVV
ncbi:hypothetical protein JRQ81_003289 [Phrynocephalus forsythii]|uniref:Uncharacterized protein n=1 Tax=Phrynocephalus forsythii TaxID=171643 RepID=A0A9Q0XMT5_9SAUR|nr:hypothetical protein JRQ81_003289 [Phrynocephalus forsythii]